jgi:hypothetical protein
MHERHAHRVRRRRPALNIAFLPSRNARGADKALLLVGARQRLSRHPHVHVPTRRQLHMAPFPPSEFGPGSGLLRPQLPFRRNCQDHIVPQT